MHQTKSHFLTQNTIFLLAAPLVTALFLLCFYAAKDFYPFGNHTVSWCDMNQQVVPLLLNFKDIFSGHGSMLYSFQNAGGMNFWGVFFFFIASPFSFLTLFVPKSNMLLFMNILVLLKLSACAFTAALYFLRSQHRIRPSFAFLFGVFYAFCGYGLLFYQNIIWLDMMYLLPLLLLSFERLLYQKKCFPYILTLSAMMVVNYYISYMVVLFTLLYFGIVLLHFTGKGRQDGAIRFLASSFIAALLTAVIWLPCFLQYLSSGRDISMLASVASADFFTPLETTLPILFPSACCLVIMIYGLLHSPLERGWLRSYVLLFLCLLLPILLEPINKMWHTGNYQGFPVRYGFITLFMAMIVAASFLSESAEDHPVRRPRSRTRYFSFFTLCILIILYGVFSHAYLDQQMEVLSHYTQTLWGNLESFKGLLILFLLSAGLYLLLYRSLHKHLLNTRTFTILCLLLCFFEAYSGVSVYMLSADYNGHQQTFASIMDLSNFTPQEDSDHSFYRVKLRQKYFDVNLVGGLGFPSLSHYTSLTSQDYMFAMKKLGYSSYWMEVGGYGGTILSDSVLSNAYEIHWNDQAPSLYHNEDYSISVLPSALSLGIPTTQALDDTNELENLTRLEIQELLFNKLFPNHPSPFISYSYEQAQLLSCSITQDAYQQYQLELTNREIPGHIYYEIPVQETQTLYFDCFDRLSNQLTEHINDSFQISVNGISIEDHYPSRQSNGLICLGTFENETVIVDIELLQSVTCRSFGLFGIRQNELLNAVNEKSSLHLKAQNRSVWGQAQADIQQTVFLSIPYDSGWTLKIDGKTAPLSRAFMGFSSFTLPAGTHSIEMKYTPPGFIPGALLTLLGAITGIFFLLKPSVKNRLLASSFLRKVASYCVQLLLLLVILFIYVLPLVLNLLEKIS